eukprot:scaffold216226_cov30-Tisochrysis_lutea.AAC.5
MPGMISSSVATPSCVAIGCAGGLIVGSSAKMAGCTGIRYSRGAPKASGRRGEVVMGAMGPYWRILR